MTLLEKALAVAPKRPNQREISNEELDVFFAWLDGKLSLSQVQSVVAQNKMGLVYSYTFLTSALRVAWQKGLLVKGGA